jgi:hypothetical protein
LIFLWAGFKIIRTHPGSRAIDSAETFSATGSDTVPGNFLSLVSGREEEISKKEILLVALAGAAYLGAAVLLITPYIGNPDQMAYISIAKKYLAGNFKDAVNGYWSPLYSWLMTPLLALRVDAVLVSQIVSVLSGLFLSLGAYALTLRFRLAPAIRLAVFLALMPSLLIEYVLARAVSPDALVAALLILYLYVVFDPDYAGKKYAVYFCALIGALAYLAKAYAFFFFLAHFLLISGWKWLQLTRGSERKRLFFRTAGALLLFLTLCAPWGIALSLKFGKPTLGTSGILNLYVLGPKSQGQPHGSAGFLPPPNPTAVFNWEDPSWNPYIPWNPVGSREEFSHWLRLIRRSVRNTGSLFQEFSFLALPILILGLVAVFGRFSRWRKPSPPALLLASIAIYMSGYLAIAVFDRYLLPAYALIAVLGLFLLDALFRRSSFASAGLRGLILGFFVFSFWLSPLAWLPRHLHQHRNYYVAPYKYTDIKIYQISRALIRRYPLRGNFAANDNHGVNEFLAYYLNIRYFGDMRRGETAAELQKDLEKYPIDYFFLWFEDGSRYPFLKSCPELTRNRFPELKIYDLRKKGSGGG